MLVLNSHSWFYSHLFSSVACIITYIEWAPCWDHKVDTVLVDETPMWYTNAKLCQHTRQVSFLHSLFTTLLTETFNLWVFSCLLLNNLVHVHIKHFKIKVFWHKWSISANNNYCVSMYNPFLVYYMYMHDVVSAMTEPHWLTWLHDANSFEGF